MSQCRLMVAAIVLAALLDVTANWLAAHLLRYDAPLDGDSHNEYPKRRRLGAWQ